MNQDDLSKVVTRDNPRSASVDVKMRQSGSRTEVEEVRAQDSNVHIEILSGNTAAKININGRIFLISTYLEKSRDGNGVGQTGAYLEFEELL